MNFPLLRNRLAENLSRYNASVQSRIAGTRPLVGERTLLRCSGLGDRELDRLQDLADKWGVSLREAAFATRSAMPEDYVRAAGKYYGLTCLSDTRPPELAHISPPPEPYRLLQSASPAILDAPRGGVVLNAESINPETIGNIADVLGSERSRLQLSARDAMTASIIKTFNGAITERAADGIWQRNPRFSAARTFISWQIIVIAAICGLFLGAVSFAPKEVLTIYGGALSFVFLIVSALRWAAALYAVKRRLIGRKQPESKLEDKELPHYTVLVALFREARILPQLVSGLSALDYPAAKLDIKLIFEEVDTETIARARGLSLPPQFEILIVPDGAPRTKPRALNYALQFARGDLLVIYDAEDRPDPQQLRVAASHFADAPPEVVCLQAQLTYDNYAENWLSKQCAIEYASLFGGILPLLDRQRLPIPLGGTSNHFRIGILRRLGAWDAYNVTEDADLGIRIYRAGLRAEVLYSETHEEAACQLGNWLRQRTRWLKGWMQTYLVHMRQPGRLVRELGISGFLTLQGHFAGTILAALIYPVSYLIIASDVMNGWWLSQPQSLLGHHLLLLAVFNLIAGFVGAVLLGAFVLKERHLTKLLPQIPLIPVYWLLISIAAYRAVYQLLTAPHFWEKTEHFGVRDKTAPRKTGLEDSLGNTLYSVRQL
ncbi:MAG: glycosyltransferase [Hyphomicrobiales bacterium]|nr:glycosyltransferase [Hyphomicrobiales bacterium]